MNNLTNTTEGNSTFQSIVIKYEGESFTKLPWKQLSDYYVSKNGKILSARGTYLRILKPQNRGKKGQYKYVRLYHQYENTYTNFNVHVLVMTIFKGPAPINKEIDHLDRNCSNNKLSNLEYVTHKENMRRIRINNIKQTLKE